MTDDTLRPMHPGMYAETTPDRLAVVMVGSDETLTYAEFEAVSNQVAHLLRRHGLKRGDVVSIYMENNLYYTALAWGGLRAGLRVNAIATHLTAGEVDYILQDCEAAALFTSRHRASVALELTGGPPHEARFMLDHDGSGGFSDLQAALGHMPTTPIDDQSEGIEMLYSSGTTGRPKGVRKVLPEVPFGIPHLGHRSVIGLYGFNEESVYLSPAPLYHAAPLAYNLRTLRAGGTTIVMPKFDAEQALALIEKHRVTHSQWVPTHFVRMLRLPGDVRAKYDLSSHVCAVHAASPCPVPVKKAMIEWWGPIIHEYYGGSEGNGTTQLNTEEWLAHPGSVGQAAIGRVRICDESGENELPVGQEGTVFFSDAPVFEYHNDPEKTASSRNSKGWSTLGDVGYLDDDGYLYLTDRRAFVIISGGVNIYPQEAENLLAAHEKVLDVAVIGVPHDEFGEEVKAVVHPLDMGDAGDALAGELIAYCREHLSAVKCPRSIDFDDALPRQENGKLYKRKLRERYWSSASTS